jgi:putative FmdB family regulatory protein
MSRLVVAADLRNADERSVRAACGLLSSVGDATGR